MRLVSQESPIQRSMTRSDVAKGERAELEQFLQMGVYECVGRHDTARDEKANKVKVEFKQGS